MWKANKSWNTKIFRKCKIKEPGQSYKWISVSWDNLVEGKFSNLCQIYFSMECFTADSLRFLQEDLKIRVLDDWPGTNH